LIVIEFLIILFVTCEYYVTTLGNAFYACVRRLSR